MFNHRVLPLPPLLTPNPLPSPLAANLNTVLPSVNMTSDTLGSADVVGTRRASLRSSSPKRNHYPTTSEKASSGAGKDLALVLHSSASTGHNRTASQDSAEEVPRTDGSYPLIATSSILTSQVCLCQPDPKVPRPRNAFILYRQHHQAAVVAANPGLANPEISKIIGDHWRSSTAETKNHWRFLAEEEKLRHQRQYPDYRYQPRRSGRGGSALSSVTSNGLETPRCPKCGGRSMISPPSIGTPTTPMSGFASIMGPPSTPSTGSSTGRFLRNMGSPAVNTPSTGGYQSRPMTSNSLVSGMRLAALREPYSESNDMPISPEAKRRRSTNATHGPVRAENGQLTPLPLNRRRESLPRPDFMQKSNFSIAAAPKPNNPSSSQEGPFTLPPIKTAHVSEASTQAKSVEAMVMSISAINKIKVLAKICPPLAPPGPTSPPQAIRGAIIAIDGTDTESIKATIEHLSEIFAKDPKHTLRIFESPPLKSSTGGEASFADYLQLINRWHSLSQEIIKFITSAPPVSPPTLISPKTIPPPNIAPPTESAADPSNLNPSSTTGPAPSSFPQHHPAPFPIALIPCYQLTRTDAAASTIPIADAYAPIDHWQWMATLWRGIVGPDITIVVRAASHETTSVGSNGVMSPGADVGRHGSVEVRLNDARAIVLRGNGKGKGVSESGLRRVGFEVGEWVRMLASAKEGRGLG